MPRPNQVRSIMGESNLAERVAYERRRRDWSLERLATKMTHAGCPIQGSAIYKIESGRPPRRITVDELLGFAKVFEVPVDELLLPVAVAVEEPIKKAVQRYIEADVDVYSATNALLVAVLDLNVAVSKSDLPADAAWQLIESMTSGPVDEGTDVTPETREVLGVVHSAIHSGVKQMLARRIGP